MKSHFLLSGCAAMACAITGNTGLLTESAGAQTFTAADYATNSAYADGWQETDNGGFGFTSWSFYGTYTNSPQHIMNPGGPDPTGLYNQLGLAWTIFLPNGKEPASGTPNPPGTGSDLSRAGRGFAPLQVGQTITTIFDNPTERLFYGGYTIVLVSGGQNVGYCCPGAAVRRLSVGTFDYVSSYFAPGRWFAGEVGNTGIYDTNTAAAGASLAMTLTGPDNYKLVLTPFSNPSMAHTNYGALSGSGPINWIMFEHYNTDSDFYNATNGVTYTNIVSPAQPTDFYIRSITISDVQPIAPAIGQQPLPQALYPGRTARFTVSAIGTSLSYRWRKNGLDLSNGGNISGALTNALVVSNVSAADVGSYTVVVTNSIGAATSAPPASLTLVQPSGAPYENAIRAAHPVAYWRFNEAGDPSTNTPAFDYWGGFVGTYGTAAQNGFNAITGPGPTAFPGLESDNNALQSTASTDQSWVTIPALNLNTNALTFTLWLYPNSDPIADYTGLIYTRRGTTSAAGVQYTTADQIGYTVNGDPYTYQFESGLTPPANQWSFVAVVIEPGQATIYLSASNTLVSATNIDTTPPYPNVAWDGIGFIGGDPDNSVDRTFDGKIDEVAIFNYSFTPQQVLNLYNAALSVNLSIQRLGANVVLTWPVGSLLEATNVAGPWTANNSTSPYTNAPTGPKKFYRVVH